MRTRFPVFLAFLLLAGMAWAPAFAQLGPGALLLNGPVRLDADTLTYDEDEGVALAEGNVEITLGSRTMKADRIRYDSRTGDAELAGKVRYKDADEEFSFDRITLNLNSETGILYNGSILIRSNNYRVSSDRIEKTGKQSFRIEKGSLTTCPCEPEADWKFEFRRSRMVLDGYAFTKDITFRVRGVPVLWLPYAAFPVKLTRQSGFLTPEFSNSKSKGFNFTLPFYWAINRWSDATITVDAMSKRGYRPEAEYRFVPNRESEGAIRGSFFRDREVHDGRWRVYGENVYHSDGWTANAQVEIPSDNQYYVDFEDSEELRSARHARSAGFLERSGENASHQLSVAWHEELEQPSGDNTVQRLPEYSATLLPYRTAIGGIEASGEAAATLFYREDGDRSVRGRGTMTLSRTLLLYPSISLTPYASLNLVATRYESGSTGWEDTGRIIPVAGATLSAEALRNFPRRGDGFVHVVGGNFGYRHVYRVSQESMPVVDRWSKLAPQNQFVLTVAQRFLRLKESASPQELASLHLEWAYDVSGRDPALTPYVDPLSPFVRVLRDQIDLGVNRQLGTDAASDIYGKLVVTPIERWSLQGETLLDPRDGTFWMGAVSAGWKRDEDHRVGVEYRATRDLADDVRGMFAWRPWRFLRLQAQMNYSLKNSGLTDGSAGFTLTPKSDCWSIGFVMERKTQPDDTGYRLVFGLKGIGSVGN